MVWYNTKLNGMKDEINHNSLYEDWANAYGADLTETEIAGLNLTKTIINLIDATLMSNVNTKWQKVAMIILRTLYDLDVKLPNHKVTDLFCAMRIRKIVKENKLESKGDLFRMRFSEVRLPDVVNTSKDPYQHV